MPDNDAGLTVGVASVVSPGAYAVSDASGDIDGAAGHGLFYRDMRHLSGLRLLFDGEAAILDGSWTRGARAEFRLFGPRGLEVSRRREVGGGMDETIELSNPLGDVLRVDVSLRCAADFVDIYEVRGYRHASERGEVGEEVGARSLRFTYRRGGFSRGTVVRVSGEGIEPVARSGGISFGVRLRPEESRTFHVTVGLEEAGKEVYLPERSPILGEAPRLETGPGAFRDAWERSVEDLESLSFDVGEGLLVPAAGAPWFMALFGRDSLITGYQAMLLSPGPAKNALRALARWQADVRDDPTDAEPGKIPHELRAGELAYFGESPKRPYYGTADATPLFLVLLNEVWRWSADDGFVRELEGVARKALAWILTEADKVQGYVAYETRSTGGLENQGWKDSKDSMLFRDGTRAKGPIAPCEVQGYVYDAYTRTAELADDVWGDADLAGELRSRAAAFRDRFNRDFWMPDRGYYALALDGEGRRVDSLTSNPGHLLWSAIVPADRARQVADHLLGEAMFSGWGIRTMAEGEGGYDPDSYHDGSVWPHDNALICLGLRRYGLRAEANRVASALLDASPHFDGRLPEVFGGQRRGTGGPVEYPSSCSPQAWAAGTIPLLVRAMLGVEPDPELRGLASDPVVPEGMGAMRLLGVPAFGKRHDLEA